MDIIHEWIEKYYYHFVPDHMSDLLKKYVCVLGTYLLSSLASSFYSYRFLKDLSKGSDTERDWCKILKETIALKSSELQNRESVPLSVPSLGSLHFLMFSVPARILGSTSDW